MQHSRAPIPVRLAPVIRNPPPPSAALVLVSEGYVMADYHTVENTKYCSVTHLYSGSRPLLGGLPMLHAVRSAVTPALTALQYGGHACSRPSSECAKD